MASALKSTYKPATRLVLGCVLICLGCVEQAVTLTRAETRLADSLYLEQRSAFKEELEDSCAKMREALLTQLIDSIKITRMEEINFLLNRKDVEGQ